MNKRILKIISTILVILLSFIFHSIYDKFPNIVTSLFFPVNESIWEHMKLIVISYTITYIIELIIIIKNNMHINNGKASLIINILFNTIFYLAIYIPIYNFIGFNEVITIGLYIISIIITEYISYKIINSKKNYTFLNKYAYLILIIILLIFIYFTYYPIRYGIFIDEYGKKIGTNRLY